MIHNRYRGEYPSDFQEELHRQMNTPSTPYITLYVFIDGSYVYDEPERDYYPLTIRKDISPKDLGYAIHQLLLS